VALLQGHEAAGLVVGLAVVLAAPEDADPFERESAQNGLVSNALGPPALAEDNSVPPVMGKRTAAAIPGAKLHLLPEESHLFFLSRWREILGDLLARPARQHLPPAALHTAAD
jgi:hypothetical protein